MSDITIPAEALEAARIAWLESASDYTRLDESIRAACIAMLEAWPGVAVYGCCPVWHAYPHIILPFTENSNERE